MNIPYLWTERLIIIKMSIPLKLDYRFNDSQSKHQKEFCRN